MTKREKILAIAVGGLLGVFVVGWLALTLRGMFDLRNTQISALTKEVKEKRLQVSRGNAAYLQMEEYQEQSPPGDLDLARSAYRAFLREHLDAVGMAEASVLPAAARDVAGIYHRIPFQIEGRGDLRQVTEFLYHFYASKQLHQIQSLRLQPITDSRLLQLRLTIEVAVVAGAELHKPLPTEQLAQLDRGTLEAYLSTIVGRNLFAPPNQSPHMQPLGRQQVAVGEELQFQIEATDDDLLDTVSYHLADNSPAGATLDAESGQFRWIAEEPGDYEFKLIARDDGLPTASVEQIVQVAVAPVPSNRPPEPRLADRRATRSEELNFTIDPRDPDSSDSHTFLPLGDWPADATLDTQTGQFRWTPQTTGEYTFELQINDSGAPREQAVANFTVTVSDPELAFDDAQHAYLISTINVSGTWQVWINVRTSGETLRLSVGDPFEIGSISGRVTDISNGQFVFTVGPITRQMRLGQNLTQATDNRPTESATGA